MSASNYFVRRAASEDVSHATRIGSLIREAAKTHSIAERSQELITDKLTKGLAAIALQESVVVGFGYLAPWGGDVISHSGIVIDPAHRNQGLLRQIKSVLLEIGDEHFPKADVISLTLSEAVYQVNLSLGYESAPLTGLTSDHGFWDGCRGCHQYEAVHSAKPIEQANGIGGFCCCKGMRRRAKNCTSHN